MYRLFVVAIGLSTACLLLLLGFSLPVGIGGIHPAVLQEVGAQTRQSADLVQAYLAVGQTGPAQLVTRTIQPQLEREAAQIDLEQMLAAHPRYASIGGPDPFLDVLLDADGVQEPTAHTVIDLFISSNLDAQVLKVLEESPAKAVQSVLQARTMTGLRYFPPIDTAGGAPLNASLLTVALLAQTNVWDTRMAQSLQSLAQRAADGELKAVEQMERLCLGVISLGTRMDWRQLAALAAVCRQPSDVIDGAELLREQEDLFAWLYTAMLMAGEVRAVVRYAEMFAAKEGLTDLQTAVAAGEGAVTLLVERMQPIIERPAWQQWLLQTSDRLALSGYNDWVAGLAARFPMLTTALWLGCFFAAGLLLAAALWGILPEGGRSRQRRWSLFSILRYVGIALIVTLVSFMLSQPQLFAKRAQEPSLLQIDFLPVATTETKAKEHMGDIAIDQITILILLIYFLVQLVIYAICLIKLTQIKKQPLSALLKIRLLENEENLFDSGLYVGLAGTVLSLITLSLGIVQASLIAAYSSTLFGILFVATLKIFHVRPLRRRLLVEADRWEGR